MWKASIQKSIRQMRFVLKQSPEHHGAWFFLHNRLDELKMLNPNTFFHVAEINEQFDTPSALHILYDDVDNSSEEILSEGVSKDDFEKVVKEKVMAGLKLTKVEIRNNFDRMIPVDIVEARKTVAYMDDDF